MAELKLPLKNIVGFDGVEEKRSGSTLSKYIANIPADTGLEFCGSGHGKIRLKLNYKLDLNNPLGIIYGGAIATLIDTAAVFSLYSDMERQPKSAVTLNMNVQYFRAARAVDLIADAEVLKMGRKIAFVQVKVKAENSEEIIAQGELSFSLSHD